MAHSAEENARCVLTIFKRLRCMIVQSVLAGNPTLPFQKDGWLLSQLEEGRTYAIERGWMEMGTDNKFMRITEAGYNFYGCVAV